MTHNYQVVVGNIGTVYNGKSFAEAKANYSSYKQASKINFGRAAGEDVVMFKDGEIYLEYINVKAPVLR